MSAAIAYAQSGHLCLATMHANNSYQALNRILSFYPVEVRMTMLGDLASALKAIVSQRLLRTVHGTRTPAVEVMLNTKLVSDLIEKGDFSGAKEAMENAMVEGSQTFEQDIARLIIEGTVDRKEGLLYADSPTNLMWRLANDFANAQKVHRTRTRRGRHTVVHRDYAGREARRLDLRSAVAMTLSTPESLATLRLAEQLLACPSVTPDDAGCMDIIAARLQPLGFVCEWIDSGPDNFRVKNLWAKRPSAQKNSAQAAPNSVAKLKDFCVCWPHRRGAHGAPGAVDICAFCAHAPRWQTLRARCQRHENLDRSHGGGGRGVCRRAAAGTAEHRLFAHQ